MRSAVVRASGVSSTPLHVVVASTPTHYRKPMRANGLAAAALTRAPEAGDAAKHDTVGVAHYVRSF
ncbi:hypothetical protein A5678_11280 [Mycobacterium sp. E2733]|nr:hypothetical protein A5678_11280 [Mycobacterium sp. E2733]